MSGGGAWLSAVEFAASAGITRRGASKALASAQTGRPWRGCRLEVRKVHGRGGRSGLHYEVSLNSLLEALEGPQSAVSEAIHSPTISWRPAANNQGAVVAERWSVIETAVDLPSRSKARGEAIAAAAAKFGHSERTINRWIAEYEAHGFAGLARKKPANAGQKRVVVSRQFDAAFQAASYPEQLLVQIGALIDQKLVDIWASRAQASRAFEVGRLAEHELWKACQGLGVQLPPAALGLSRRHVEQFVTFRQVNIWRNNRKAFDDGKPRISRDWTPLAPLERVVADVKHLEVVITRPDGSEAWPKVVGFQDGGTGRVFLYPLLLGRGEGVRQEHVIEAFIAMASDPAWGFPNGLYLDNGSEFACFEKIRAAFELVNQEAGRAIIYSKPYNASAKTIENAFKRLDTYLFSALPGYAGGDRMRKKVQTVGKPPAPYPHGWEQFCKTLTGLLVDFNSRPVGGQWQRRSALDWFEEKVGNGWRPVSVDPLVLDAAFCDRRSARSTAAS